MKFSDYLTASPASPRVQQTVTVRDENREAILEQQVNMLTQQLTKYTDQVDTIEELKKKHSHLMRVKQDVDSQLNEATSSLTRTSSQLENQTKLTEEIKSLKQIIEDKEHSVENLHSKANNQERELTKQQNEIATLTIDKHALEEEQVDLQRRTRYAEQKHEDITGEIKFVKGKFAELETISGEMSTQHQILQKELSERIDQCVSLRTSIQQLEEEVERTQRSNSSLHDSLESLQTFYSNTKDELSYSTQESNKLETTVTSLLDSLKNIETENKMLVNKQHSLEIALAKPKYMSQSMIERQEGFKMPLASGALNMRKNSLGTGKPTLLRFKKKELANDN